MRDATKSTDRTVKVPREAMRDVRGLDEMKIESVLVREGSTAEGTSAALLRLLDEVTAEPEARARAVLATLAAHPRDAYAGTKRSMREGVIAGARGSVAEMIPTWVSDDVKARILAVLKR